MLGARAEAAAAGGRLVLGGSAGTPGRRGRRDGGCWRGREVVVLNELSLSFSKHIFRGVLMSHKEGAGARDAWATYANSLEKLRQK